MELQDVIEYCLIGAYIKENRPKLWKEIAEQIRKKMTAEIAKISQAKKELNK